MPILLRTNRAEHEGFLVVREESPGIEETEAREEVWPWGDVRSAGDVEESAAAPRFQEPRDWSTKTCFIRNKKYMPQERIEKDVVIL